jgi:hypothetical protein
LSALTYLLPLATIDDVRGELEDTNRSLLRLGEGLFVDEERLAERRAILIKWRDRLACQLDDMTLRGAS